MNEQERRRIAQQCLWAMSPYDSKIECFADLYDEILAWEEAEAWDASEHDRRDGLVAHIEYLIVAYRRNYERLNERYQLIFNPIMRRLPLTNEISERFDPEDKNYPYQWFLMNLKAYAAMRAIELWNMDDPEGGGPGMDLWRRFAFAALSLQELPEVPTTLSPEDKEEELDDSPDHAA